MSGSFEEYLSALVADLIGHGMTELGAAAVVAAGRDELAADYARGVPVEMLGPCFFDPDDHAGVDCVSPVLVRPAGRRVRLQVPLRPVRRGGR